MKLAKALQFCFERHFELAHMPTLTRVSSRPEFPDQSERHHYQGASSQPVPLTPSAEVDQDILVAEMMNIQDAGFSTSPLATASSLSLHPVSSLLATLSPAPMVRMPAEQVAKPLGPMPNVLIVEDNPINVRMNQSIVCIASRLLTTAHLAAHASGNIHSEEEVPIHQSREWTSRCGSCEGNAREF
jgi:hypothetical protein